MYKSGKVQKYAIYKRLAVKKSSKTTYKLRIKNHLSNYTLVKLIRNSKPAQKIDEFSGETVPLRYSYKKWALAMQ